MTRVTSDKRGAKRAGAVCCARMRAIFRERTAATSRRRRDATRRHHPTTHASIHGASSVFRYSPRCLLPTAAPFLAAAARLMAVFARLRRYDTRTRCDAQPRMFDAQNDKPATCRCRYAACDVCRAMRVCATREQPHYLTDTPPVRDERRVVHASTSQPSPRRRAEHVSFS